jgi:hypothetical protein
MRRAAMPLYIFVGTADIPFTVTSGDFYCPRCLTTRPFTLKSSRRFFTIYWLPVFPISGRTRYVECDSCHTQFAESVLDLEPDTEERQFGEMYAGLRDGASLESLRPLAERLGYSANEIEEVLTKMCTGRPKACPCGLRYHPSATKCTGCGAGL